MFKNLNLYQIKLARGIDDWKRELAANTFVPTGPTQQLSAGWVPPRGEDGGELMVACGRHRLVRLMIEQRAVPTEILDREVAALAKVYEDQTGRKPGKKNRREMKEAALLELLPRAFPKRSSVMAWVDQDLGLLAVDTSSATRSGLVVQALPQSVEIVTHLTPADDAQVVMSRWLVDGEASHGFTVDRECELRATGDGGETIRYQNHDLGEEEMARRQQAGLLPTKLAVTYNSRVSFVLTDAFALRKIRILDAATIGATVDEKADAFDADLAIATGELELAINAMIAAFGGVKRAESA